MNNKPKPYYPILESEIAKRGIRKKDIAAALDIPPRTLSNKITGKVDFWYEEACTIQRLFFNDITKDALFSHSVTSNRG